MIISLFQALILVCVLVLISAALVHFYWAAGGTRGLKVAIPQIPLLDEEQLARLERNQDGGIDLTKIETAPAFTPTPAATYGVAFALIVLALALAGRTGFWESSNTIIAFITQWLCRVGGLICGLRALGDGKLMGFTKRIRHTEFAAWDSLVYSPLLIIMAIVLLAVSW